MAALVEVEVRSFKEVDLAGGTLIGSVPSVGLVSSIASTFLIDSLRMDQVSAFESDEFPPLSMVYAHKPKFPTRVYASSANRLAVFLAEVPLHPRLHRPVARTLLKWARDRKCKLMLTLEGLPSPEGEAAANLDLWGVGSTDAARGILDKHGIRQLETGIIAGVSGVLLNEGRWQNFDVISLLSEARPMVPDAAAAVKIVEGIAKVLPNLKLDLAPLEQNARQFEERLQALRHQAKAATEVDTAPMYR